MPEYHAVTEALRQAEKQSTLLRSVIASREKKSPPTPDETEALLARFTAGTVTDPDWHAAFAVCWPEVHANRVGTEVRIAWWDRRRDYRDALAHLFYLPAADLLRPEGWEICALQRGYPPENQFRITTRGPRKQDVVFGCAPTMAHAMAAAAIRAATMEKEMK